MVSITFQPLYPLGRSPRNPFNTTVVGAQFWSGLFGEENDFFTFSRTTHSFGQTARSLNSIPTDLTKFYSLCHFQIFRKNCFSSYGINYKHMKILHEINPSSVMLLCILHATIFRYAACCPHGLFTMCVSYNIQNKHKIFY